MLGSHKGSEREERRRERRKKNDGRDKNRSSFPTDLILFRLAHLDICTAEKKKMSAEMTFWHLRLPDKSKHHVHISQACVSFSLAVARDLLCKYCERHWKAGE